MWRCLVMLALALAWPSLVARAQVPAGLLGGDDPAESPLSPAAERFKALTKPDPDAAETTTKDRRRPPFEYYRSQVAPFDILPFYKPNHWTTIGVEVRANHDDYAGLLLSEPIPLIGTMNQQVLYRREAHLMKEQRTRLGLHVMVPSSFRPGRMNKELLLELTRPQAIRFDDLWAVSLRPMEPHQMLVLVLADDPNAYAHWARFQVTMPAAGDSDPATIDQQRYYRLVLPLEPEHPVVSPHPLTWTTTSHVLWDGLGPDALNFEQQQAMIDWLHWGGQLIVIAGAGPSVAPVRETLLGPYLPADTGGENVLLDQQDLMPLAQAYRAPVWPDGRDRLPTDPEAIDADISRLDPGALEFDPAGITEPSARYKPVEPIRPLPNRPVFLTGLQPREGATVIPLGPGSDRILGVEWRVGRGRVLMLGLNPTDPALAAWSGLDSLVRRVLLRRPEEPLVESTQAAFAPFGGGMMMGGRVMPQRSVWMPRPLGAGDLTWVRYLSRDLGAPVRAPQFSDANEDDPSLSRDFNDGSVRVSRDQIGAWIDQAELPQLCRNMLAEASGISIPSARFVVRVVLAYLIALVPLNWLVCRYVLGRREWAWLVVPTLALGFAFGVERAAAYDLGYDSACDEIAVLELHEGYPRAHLSRFAALYTTGRVRYEIGYPDAPTALALPLDTGMGLRGGRGSQSIWQSLPYPALTSFQVQPRSLSMFRAEQMLELPGPIDLIGEPGAERIVNHSGLELRDAVLVDGDQIGRRPAIALGTLAPGASVALDTAGRDTGEVPEEQPDIDLDPELGALDPRPFLHWFRSYHWGRPEDRGELRLVAWTPRPMPGQVITPAVDRHRGFTVVVAHLRFGPPPDPSGPHYLNPPEEPVAAFDPAPEPGDDADRRLAARRSRPFPAPLSPPPRPLAETVRP